MSSHDETFALDNKNWTRSRKLTEN